MTTLKKIAIPDKCTGNCHFRILYSSGFWFCTLFGQSISHIVRAKKCNVTVIKLCKGRTQRGTGLSFAHNFQRIYYCLDCAFIRQDPASSQTPWCSLYKILITELGQEKWCMSAKERKEARREQFQKCSLTAVILLRDEKVKKHGHGYR